MIEILAGHLFNMFTIIMGQTALVFVCMLVIFNIPCQGNLALAVFITCLQGFVGMCFGKNYIDPFHSLFNVSSNFLSFVAGLLITTGCDDEATALNLSQASFIPLLVMGGICWPIEGMPYYLRYIAYSMPVTYAIESLRSIFSRGWGIEEVDVYAGILISIAWIFVLLILSLIVVRTRKYSNWKLWASLQEMCLSIQIEIFCFLLSFQTSFRGWWLGLVSSYGGCILIYAGRVIISNFWLLAGAQPIVFYGANTCNKCSFHVGGIENQWVVIFQ